MHIEKTQVVKKTNREKAGGKQQWQENANGNIRISIGQENALDSSPCIKFDETN